ncbi:MAG: hypothetical protein AAFY38_00290 [Pseudomonadota bacterium]
MRPYIVASGLWLCVLFAWLAHPGHAEHPGLCVTPILNDPAQMSAVEVDQPYRLVSWHATGVLDTYPGLLIHPTNRAGIYTVSNGEYKRVPDEIERQITRFGPPRRVDRPVFDASKVPDGFTRNDMPPKYYPEIGLFLTRNANSIWYRKPDEVKWHPYVKASLWNGLRQRNMRSHWVPPTVWRDDTTGMIVMTLHTRQIIVGHQAAVGADLTFEYQALRGGRFIDLIHHEETGHLLFWKDDRKLHRLALPRIVQVDVPWGRPPGQRYMRYPDFSETDPKTGDVLFRHFGGMARYDGRRVTDIAHWSNSVLSRYTKIIWLNGKRYAETADGLFHLDDDLVLTRITTPVDPVPNGKERLESSRAVNPFYSAELDLILMTRGEVGLFTTQDFSTFHEARRAPDVKITQIVSDIPNERAVLLLGADGLYQVALCND